MARRKREEMAPRQQQALDAHRAAVDMLTKAHDAMIELAAARHECKLSTNRVTGVARELKELLKVMAICGRQQAVDELSTDD
jgi:hypothetical protein